MKKSQKEQMKEQERIINILYRHINLAFEEYKKDDNRPQKIVISEFIYWLSVVYFDLIFSTIQDPMLAAESIHTHLLSKLVLVNKQKMSQNEQNSKPEGATIH